MDILVSRLLWSFLGSISLIGGAVGLVLPVIPQIPFFIFALFCLTKASPRFERWLHRQTWYLKLVKTTRHLPIVGKLLSHPQVTK